MIKKITLFILTSFLLLFGFSLPALAAASYEETFYIAPIVNVFTPSYETLMDMKARLGTGGYYSKIGFTASVFYMSETKGSSQDWIFDPAKNINNIINLSKQTNLPVFIVLNGGPWGGMVDQDPNISLIVQLEQEPLNVQWKDDGTVPGDQEYLTGLGRILTYNHLNTEIRRYRERNLKAAAQIIYQFYLERPDLLIGVNTDPEIFMSPYYATDYNPDTIRQFQIYEELKYGGNLAAFNRDMGTSFGSWNEVGPPRPIFGEGLVGNRRGEEWTDFKIKLVDDEVQREVDWFREVGFPANRIYTHQTVPTNNPIWTRYTLASPLETASVNGGSIGLTTFQDVAFDENLFATARSWSPNWALLEHNPSKSQDVVGSASYNWVDHYLRTFRALQLGYKHGAHIIAPLQWEYVGNEPFYTVKGSAFEVAIRDFIKQAGSNTTRLWGNTSHGTAVAISQTGWNRSKVVLLARDDYFSDALAGVPLAYAFKNDPAVGSPVPLLLTNSRTLSPESLREMKRLGTEIAIILGGPGAITENVANQLRGSGIAPDRIYGETSYGTAADIARRIRYYATTWGTFSAPDTAIIATGINFQDSLAVSSPAAANNMPILLTTPDSLSSETSAALQEAGIRKVIIVGGGAVVSGNVEVTLNTQGYNVLARLWGATEYETAVDIATRGNAFFHFPNPGSIFIARGDFFTDGLAGGALASRMNPAPILLVETRRVPEATASHLSSSKANIPTIYVLGGSGAITEATLEELDKL